MSGTRRRPKVDDSLVAIHKEFDVVHEAEQRAGELGVQVIAVRSDDPSPWHGRHDAPERLDRVFRIDGQWDRIHPL